MHACRHQHECAVIKAEKDLMQPGLTVSVWIRWSVFCVKLIGDLFSRS